MPSFLRLAPPAPLFNVGCKFVFTFLATTAWHSLFRLGTTLNYEEVEFWVSLNMSNLFSTYFYETILILKNICHSLTVCYYHVSTRFRVNPHSIVA